jgi:CheY-like chemotaxis protein
MAIRRVLVVEDEEDIQKVIRMSLRVSGVPEVLTAGCGEECLEIVHQLRPDLILLDVTLPNLNGLEICRRLKADPVTRLIPVIFLSAMTQSNDYKKGMEAGALGYLAKPFDPMALYNRIVELLAGESGALCR